MSKQRFLTVLVPIKDSDCEPTVYQDLAALVEAVPASLDNINKIYKVKDGSYYRVFTTTAGIVTYHRVYDREFPYLGRPLEIYDFTYDATRMGNAPTISAQGVMWYADKGANDEDITLDGLWTQQCHVVFNGEKLYLKRIPTSSKSNEDARYKYDLDFVDESIVLERVYLYDVVNPFIAERPVSESATFSFFGDIYELAKRINASLIRSGLASLTRKYVGYPQHPLVNVPYLTYEQWTQLNIDGDVLVGTVFQNQAELIEFYNTIFLALEGDYDSYLLQYIYENENGVFDITGYQCVLGNDKYGEQVTSEEKLVSFDKAYIHDALQQFHDTFDLQYYITREKDNGGSYTGNVLIVVGDCEYDFADIDQETGDYVRDEDGIPMTESPFDYGVEDELLSKGKNNTTDKIVNRITGVGSAENIPWYYPNPTPDGWIKPILTRNGEEIQEVTLEYPTDEGTTSEDYTRYEKFLRNRIGNTIKRGAVRIPIYKNDYVTGSDSSDGDYMTIAVTYEINLPSSGIVYPRFTFQLDYKPSISKCGKFTATLRRDDGYVLGEYDSTQIYSELTNFQTMMMTRDGSVVHGLFPYNSTFFLDITYRIPISLLPNSVEYDYEGYRYPSVGLPVGQTGLTAYASENFYQEQGLQPFVQWEILGGTTPMVYDCGYSTDGTPNGKVAPIPRRKGSKYKNVSNGIVYYCNKSESPSSHADFINGTNKDAFDANPKMNYEEWINEFVTMNLLVYEANYWFIGQNQISLEDYGLNIYIPGGTVWGPDIFDKIEFQRLKWLTPQPNLMPEVYIKTDGERRFYNAKNYWNADEESLIYGVADTDIGEEQVGENQVRNPIFKENETDADSEHYEFENEYIKSMPNEHIEDFDDIRPSIVGQSNYVAVPYIFESIIADWSNQYMNYFTKNDDGTYSNATPTYDPDTLYYVLLRIDVVEEFAYDLTENDEIWESSDNGSVQGEYKHPYFFAKLRPLGFNLFDMALQEDMVLSMTTGHCGACNFKIGVDENSKKNPVQLWEYDVYKGDTLQGAELLYEAGTLRRYVDLTGLYYDTDGTQDGYTPIQASEGILIGAQPLQYLSAVPMYQAYNYTAEAVKNGYVGSMKERGTVHFEGDVVTDGRFIESQQDTTDNYVWVALMKDTESYGTIMPSTRPNYNDASLNQYIRPKSIQDVHTDTSTQTEDEENADKFVFVNIKMPQIYLRRAERELSKELVKYMHEHNYQKFNFTIKFSRIYIEQNPNTDNNLNENSVLYVLYNGISYRQYVKHYSYRMTHDAPLPEISVDMNEELSVSKTIMKQWDESAKRNNDRLSSSFNSLVKQTQNRIDRTTLKKDGTYVFSGNIIVNGEETSLIEMAREFKGGGSKGGGNAEIDESNLVHKTGDETIDGAKTFVQGVIVGESGIIDFLPTENAKNEITISNSTHDTNPQQSGATTYIGVLQFDDADTGGYVRLRGIESPALGHDAVNKDYLESAIAVYINGQVGSGGVAQGNLFAFGFTDDPTEMQITQFVKGLPNQPNITLLPVTDYLFPIGCNIYYCPNFDLITPYADVEEVMVYSSYQRVSLANNAIYRGANPLGTGEYSAVYLRVTVVDGKYWRPFGKEGATIEIIVSADQLEANNTYIYLGRSVGSSEANPVFQLEDNNPLYYFDGTSLIDWASYIAEDSAAGSVQSITVGTTTTGEPGTNANVVNSGTPTNQILDFTIPRGADAVNPFKGWYASANALPANPVVGDYAYVKGANASDPAAIYECTTAGTWSDSGRTADTSNVQTFATGEEVNEVRIVNDLMTGGSEDVLSAEQGKQIGDVLYGISTKQVQIHLYQFNTTRLSSDVFRTDVMKDLLSKFWLSDDVNYSCYLVLSNSDDYTDYTEQIEGAPWGSSKEVVQNAILSNTRDYFWLFFRKGDGTASISPSELELEGIIGKDEHISLYQYNTTRLSVGILRTDCMKDLLSNFWLSDDVNYSCILIGNNTPTRPREGVILVDWGGTKNQVQSAILSCSYTYFYMYFRKGDGTANISPSELNLTFSQTGTQSGGLIDDVNEIKSVLQKEDYSQYIDCSLDVDTNVAEVDDVGLALQDNQVFESDNGRIYLPKSYSPMGEKTRLIIHCHGASQNYNNGSIFPKTSSLVTIDYLLAKGYAVLDVNGMPGTNSFYATTIGNPIAYRSYTKVYEWAVNTFNLYKEIFVIGISAGSVPALQISNISNIPVLACVTYCGIMDFTRGWMLLGGYHPNNQGPLIKGYLADKFAFTGTQPTLGNVDPCSDDEWKYLVDNVEKFNGWNPYTMGITSTMTREEYREIVSTVYGTNLPSWIDSNYETGSVQQMLMAFKIPQRTTSGYETKIVQEKKLFDSCSIYRNVPLKIFHATNDNIAPYRYSQYYYDMCKRGGSIVEMRTFSSGGHNPTGNEITVTVNNVSITTNVLTVEVLDWLQRFE